MKFWQNNYLKIEAYPKFNHENVLDKIGLLVLSIQILYSLIL